LFFSETHVITALAGGVGAAKLLTGVAKLVKEEDLTIIGNTGDDIEIYGLHVSPDLDIVTYTLAGVVDEEKGWGIRGDTFHCLEAFKKLGQETWFMVGDRDLATHVFRTALLKQGKKLSEATAAIGRMFGLNEKVLPMTDDHFETRIVTEHGAVHFQEYLVKRQAKDEVLGVEFAGADKAKPADGVVEAVMDADLVIVCPSNPVVSIGTILAVNGIREALRRSDARRIAVSPIVAGAPIKGPAGKLLRGLGLEVSAYSVAKLYADFLDVFVIDVADESEKERIEQIGVEVKVANTVMRSLDDKISLANVVLES
jgi:LPPG:FO 2-phospho-L-lactate transferase